MARLDPYIGFLFVVGAAFVALLQTWHANGRPRSGSYLLGFAAGPFVAVVLVAALNPSLPVYQLIIDVVWGVAFVALALGVREFIGSNRSTRALLVPPILGAGSGIVYMIAPESAIAFMSGSLPFLAGYVVAVLMTGHGAVDAESHEARRVRRVLLIGTGRGP